MDDKQFIHTLNNRLAVAYGNGKLIMKRLEEDHLTINLAEVQTRMEKLITALEGAADLIKQRSIDSQAAEAQKKAG